MVEAVECLAVQAKAKVERCSRGEEDMGAEEQRNVGKQTNRQYEWERGNAAALGHVSYHVDIHASLVGDMYT